MLPLSPSCPFYICICQPSRLHRSCPLLWRSRSPWNYLLGPQSVLKQILQSGFSVGGTQGDTICWHIPPSPSHKLLKKCSIVSFLGHTWKNIQYKLIVYNGYSQITYKRTLTLSFSAWHFPATGNGRGLQQPIGFKEVRRTRFTEELMVS